MRSDPPSRRAPPAAASEDLGQPMDIDVSSLPAEAVTVDVLARLQLAVLRQGGRIRLCHASTELRDLVAFMGLEEVLPV